jgi:hypothetical protein
MKRKRRGGCSGVLVVVAFGLAAYMMSMRQPEPTAPAAPTADVAHLEATGAAVEPALRDALAALPDLQGVRDVSAMDAGGWYVSIGVSIAGADDVPETMERIRAAVEAVVAPVVNLRVTSYVREVPQRAWLWESGAWTSASAR